jgi:DNA-binding MarR family transcriptional regulator
LVWSGRLADEALERTAIASGLRRRGDYEVLALLRRIEPTLLTPLQVAQQLLNAQSDMTGKLDRLHEQGLIQRTPDPNDRRAVGLGITDSGRALVDDAFTKNLSVYESMLDDLKHRGQGLGGTSRQAPQTNGSSLEDARALDYELDPHWGG